MCKKPSPEIVNKNSQGGNGETTKYAGWGEALDSLRKLSVYSSKQQSCGSLITEVTGMKLRREASKQTLPETLKTDGSRYALGSPRGFSNDLGEGTENLLLS